MKPETTVIGSYPVKYDNMDFMNSYFEEKEVSWNKYVDDSVADMVNAGINIVSTGQTKDPFVHIFLRNIGGCRIRERPEVIDKVRYIGPITVDEIKYAKTLLPDKTKIMGLLTGPYTLAKSCVDLFYNDYEKLAFDLANVLNQEAKNLEKHVDLISVDEPFFSVDFPQYGKELLEIIFKDVAVQKRLHVCGDVSSIVSELLEMPVDILSHEFKASPKLFDSFKEYSLSKNICLGSVRSDDKRVESIEEISKHIKKGIEVFGEKIIQLSPDCGLRMMPRESAFQKLTNLVKAGGIVYG